MRRDFLKFNGDEYFAFKNVLIGRIMIKKFSCVRLWINHPSTHACSINVCCQSFTAPMGLLVCLQFTIWFNRMSTRWSTQGRCMQEAELDVNRTKQMFIERTLKIWGSILFDWFPYIQITMYFIVKINLYHLKKS